MSGSSARAHRLARDRELRVSYRFDGDLGGASMAITLVGPDGGYPPPGTRDGAGGSRGLDPAHARYGWLMPD